MSRRRRKKAASGGGGGDTEWLLTFSDVLTLLITFFVLLISMSSMDSKRLKEAFGFFQGALGVLETGKGQRPRYSMLTKPLGKKERPATQMQRQQTDTVGVLGRLRQRVSMVLLQSQLMVTRLDDREPTLSEAIGQSPLNRVTLEVVQKSKAVKISRRRHQVEVNLNNRLLFVRGAARLRPGSAKLLAALAGLSQVEGVRRKVVVYVDHAEHAPGFDSPWTLAGWRAALLARRIGKGAIAAVASYASPEYVTVILSAEWLTSSVAADFVESFSHGDNNGR